MPSANRAAAATLAAMSLAACGTTAKPVAGTLRADAKARKQVDDPRTKHIACLRGARIPVVTVGQTELEVGTPPTQAKIVYTPTPGSGQQAQIGGDAPGAEEFHRRGGLLRIAEGVAEVLDPARDPDAPPSAVPSQS